MTDPREHGELVDRWMAEILLGDDLLGAAIERGQIEVVETVEPWADREQYVTRASIEAFTGEPLPAWSVARFDDCEPDDFSDELGDDVS